MGMMGGAVRPTDIIAPGRAKGEEGEWKKLSEVPVERLAAMRKEQPEEYRKLYKAEYGIAPEM